MIRAIGFLRLGELTFPTGDTMLGLLNRMKSSLESGHPARQRRTLSLKVRPELLEPMLAFGIGRA
jgi:hypothetical protein